MRSHFFPATSVDAHCSQNARRRLARGSAVQYSYFQRFIVKMTSDKLPLTVPNRHNSVGVSSKRKLLVRAR